MVFIRTQLRAIWLWGLTNDVASVLGYIDLDNVYIWTVIKVTCQRPMNGISVPGNCKIPFFSWTFRQAVGTACSVQRVPESLRGETEQPDHEANNSSSVEVEKGWSYTSPSFTCRYVVRLDTFPLRLMSIWWHYKFHLGVNVAGNFIGPYHWRVHNCKVIKLSLGTPWRRVVD